MLAFLRYWRWGGPCLALGLWGLLSGCGDNVPSELEAPYEFTRADHDRCVNWPICPDGIVRLADQQRVPVLATMCRATFGIPLSCGPCIDTRAPACAPFVGPCMAPNAPQVAPEFCGHLASPPNPPPFGVGWTLCTGAVQDGPAAQLVCGDAAVAS